MKFMYKENVPLLPKPAAQPDLKQKSKWERKNMKFRSNKRCSAGKQYKFQNTYTCSSQIELGSLSQTG